MPDRFAVFGAILRRTDGSVAVMTGMMMTILVPAVIGAIDLAHITSVRNTAQSHLDSAVLVASRMDDIEEAEKDGLTQEYGSKFFLNSLRNSDIDTTDAKATFVYDKGDNLMNARAVIKVSTIFAGKVFDLEDMVLVAQTKPKEKLRVEIALSLDASGSMNWEVDSNTPAPAGSRRIDVLRDGIASMREALESKDHVEVMISVVPYSASVNVSSTKIEGSWDWVVEQAKRSGRGGYSIPRQAPDKEDVSTKNTGTPSTPVMPMEKAEKVWEYFDTIEPGGGTAGHIGAEWALYSLMPSWEDIWDHSEKPKEVSEEVRKFLVVMTDGDFTVTQTTGMTIDDAYEMFQDVCRAARKEGVTIFTIGLKASEKTDMELTKCAASVENYFPVADRTGMESAFAQIASTATELRITE